MSIAEKLSKIADNEQKVYDAGYEKGKAEGGNTTAAYEQGFSDGEKQEYDRMWDAIQWNGTRHRYMNAFYGSGWTDESFNPKYSFAVTSGGNAQNMFLESKIENAAYDDKVDFSNYISLASAFSYSLVKKLKVIDARGTTAAYNGMSGIFSNCKQLESIDQFYPSTNTNFAYTFGNCLALTNITFCSEIAVNGLNLQWSTLLSKESIFSIINNLSAETSGLTLTLSLKAINSAFETAEGIEDGSESEEWNELISQKENWTISLV